MVSCRDTEVIFSDYNVTDTVEGIRGFFGVCLLGFPPQVEAALPS